MHRFLLKHLHLKVFKVQTSGIKHGKSLRNGDKKKKIAGNFIWRMQNFLKFGENLIWRITKNVKFCGNLIWQFKAKSAKSVNFSSRQNFYP